MKKTLLFSFVSVLGLTAMAAETEAPATFPDVMLQKLSPNGEYAVGQDIYGTVTLAITTSDNEIAEYEAVYPGGGKCVSNNGVIVGQDIATYVAAIMMNGKVSIPDVFKAKNVGDLFSITPDGSRAVGYMSNANPASQTYAVPCYVDLNEDGVPGEPVALPYPDTDLLGDTPQVVNACWISDDGKTIAGNVIDGTGLYYYPIVFTLQDNNEWDYTLPSKSMFNPNGVAIPKFPDEADYSTVDEFYEAIDEYWVEMKKVTEGSNFALNIQAMNPEGTLLATCLTINNSEAMGDITDGYILCVFNLEDNSHVIYDLEYSNIIPIQYLNDGSLVLLEPATYIDFILPADANQVISFEDYLSEKNPTWLTWMEENLLTATISSASAEKEFLLAGLMSFSNDFSVMSGYTYSMDGNYSYILKNDNAGVESIAIDNANGIKVYDLLGNKVLDTKDASKINSLGKGLYIINGKKVILK